ncbi:phosphate/phosphite/phosphonate ABC transporter substrate-binding protein [Variovorax sp. PBL-E5]|uniref:phosphate/phosphite/phosphonate ABC transporter substrate-binding protein n=1 Tax=Variovorax sp. PBL-E5 TaxID=434014 RepID=UPI0013A5BAE7|nr:PhnD/SsuA/transferrin family substrate-binding protein [Variovorax sp. PBL-E5]
MAFSSSGSITPIANARMYSATPAVRAEWRRLLQWVLARAGLDWPVVDYDAPAPLSVLWAREDLGLATMCGLPFSQRAVRPTLIAAPVPSPPRYGGRPIYFTDIVVRAASPHQRLEDSFGGVVGYTLADSMSGGVALAAHLALFRQRHGARLFRAAVGGLVNARGVIEALAEGRIDVGPLDSYYHDLLRHNEPALAAQVRVVASTGAMPIPPFVATAALGAEELKRLRDALRAVATADELQATRRCLLLEGFALPDAADYAVLAGIADRPLPSFEEL